MFQGQKGTQKLFSTGNPKLLNTGSVITDTINKGQWQVTYATDDQSFLLQQDHLTYLLTFAIGIIVISISYMFFSQIMSQLIRRDLQMLAKHIKDYGAGAKQNIIPVRLVEFLRPIKVIDKAINKLKPSSFANSNLSTFSTFSTNDDRSKPTDYEHNDPDNKSSK